MSPAADLNPPPPAEAAFKAMRRAPDAADTQLTTGGQALMSSLDEALRPKELTARYPRIVNQIARYWRFPAQMDKYLNDLLMDTRGNRQGFPLRIVMELSTLREHYTGMSGTARAAGVWDENHSLFGRHR